MDSKNYIDMIDNITRLRKSFLIKKKRTKINKKGLCHVVVVNAAVVERYHREREREEWKDELTGWRLQSHSLPTGGFWLLQWFLLSLWSICSSGPHYFRVHKITFYLTMHDHQTSSTPSMEADVFKNQQQWFSLLACWYEGSENHRKLQILKP